MAAGPTALQVAAGAAALGLLIWLALVGIGQQRDLRARQDRLAAETQALWSMVPLAATDPSPLPPLGGYALSPPAAAALLHHVARSSPRRLVELGPGSSTALLLRLSRALGLPLSITCVEHDPSYARALRAATESYGVEAPEVVEAPLEPVSVAGWSGRWYSPAAIDRSLPAEIDFLLVDGPPESSGERARYPAYPMLRDRLADGATIFVDDTSRRAERAMVGHWLAGGRLELMEDGGDFVVLRACAPSGPPR